MFDCGAVLGIYKYSTQKTKGRTLMATVVALVLSHHNTILVTVVLS
jgi:hypothetical protein